MRTTLGALLLLAAAATARAQSDEVRQFLKWHEDCRPTSEELAIYGLDWAPDYDTALARAREEDRPILLVRVHAQYGNMTTGHC